jgi:hypothetical protein
MLKIDFNKKKQKEFDNCYNHNIGFNVDCLIGYL